MYVRLTSLLCVSSDPLYSFRCRMGFISQLLEFQQCDWGNFASAEAHYTAPASGVGQLLGAFLVQGCITNLFELACGFRIMQKWSR